MIGGLKISTNEKFLHKPVSKKTFAYYSLLFLVACVFIYSYYFWAKGSFIWESDGFSQHFQLYDEYVKILQGVFRGEGFPQWDWSIGPGADTISSYGYYVIGDPFVYLGVLFPESLREFSFHLLIFLRMWCVGLSYLTFVRKFKVSHGAGLLGAFMYTFSFFVIYNAKRHPFFILPLIWFPLLCLGVEKILRKESGLLFSVMVTISALANFYFFYKLTILTFIYGLVRYGTLYKYKDLKQLAISLGRCVLHYIVGLLTSAIVFLPMVGGFLDASRSTEGTAINLLIYHISYYLTILHNLFVPDSYLWTAGGLSIFAIFTVLFLWKIRKEKTFSGPILLILGIFLLFPFLGSFMNGFSGPLNRFSFALPFFLSLASGRLLEERDKLAKRDLAVAKYVLIFFTLMYGIAVIVEGMYLYYILPITWGWLIWYLLQYEIKNEVNRQMHNRISVALVGIVLLNMATNAMSFYYPYGNNSISNSIELGTSIEKYENLFGGIEGFLPEEEKDIYRVGVTSQDDHVRNQFIYHDLMGMGNYLSIINGGLSDFAEELEIASYQVIQPLRNGMDDRRILNHFFDIEYILTEAENESYLPNGYDVIHQSEDNPAFIMAQTEANYPFAYVEDSIMSHEDFSKLHVLEKEHFLTQGVVVETDEMANVSSLAEEPEVEEVPFDIEYIESGAQLIDENTIEVTDNEAKIKLSLENASELAGDDVFIYLQGLNYEASERPFYLREKTQYDMRFYYEGRRKSLRQSDKYTFSTYFYRENMFVNLGNTENGSDEIFIQFKDTGKYKIDDITVFALSVDEAKDLELADEKRQQVLDIEVFEDERIEGTIERDDPGILVTTIPYEKGWTVSINGEEVETMKANIGFIGVPVEAGESEIVFTYQNPYLKAGEMISLVGIVLLVVVQVVERKRIK